MKYKILILLSVLISSCSSEVKISNIALDLKKLEKREIIKQSEDREGILAIIKPVLWEQFEKSNLIFRKSDFEKTWSVYEDQKFIIITGTVGRSKENIQMFTILLKDGEMQFAEIGDEKVGEYPKSIIPFTKI